MRRDVVFWVLGACALLNGCGGDGSEEIPLTPETYSLRPLWRVQYDSGDESGRGYDNPYFIIAAEGVVVVSGSGGTDFGLRDGILRAYDAESGRLLWSETIEGAECQAGFGDMKVLRGTLVVGRARCTQATVLSYDLRSGEQLWSKGVGDPIWPSSPLLASDGTRVASLAPAGEDMTVTMHDAADGGVVWKTVTDLSVFPFIASSEHVVVAAASPDHSSRPRIRAYEAATGEELWNTDVGPNRLESLHAMAMGGGVLVTATSPSATFGSRIQVRDEVTGSELWSSSTFAYVRSIVVDDERVYVAGMSRGGVRDKFSVIAYSKSNGDLLWSYARARGGDERAEWAVLNDGRLIVGGTYLQIRVFDSATGEVLEQVFEDPGVGIARGLAAADGRVFSLAGAFETDVVNDENQDFLIRAFDEEFR